MPSHDNKVKKCFELFWRIFLTKETLALCGFFLNRLRNWDIGMLWFFVKSLIRKIDTLYRIFTRLFKMADLNQKCTNIVGWYLHHAVLLASVIQKWTAQRFEWIGRNWLMWCSKRLLHYILSIQYPDDTTAHMK
jgi:hypothetical protein